MARPFTLAAWAMLTAGIVLGGWWAYMELGWGGYWAWDPVENASLIPWLIATAALHTMLIQTRRNKLHGVNVFLMALTTISAFVATYLVRSGVVQSVHAFGSGGVGVPLLLFILISVALSFWIALLARRSDAGELAGIESREGFLILTSWLLLAGIRVCAGGFSEALPEGVESWLGIAVAFDAVFLAAGLVLFPFVFSGDE